MALLPYFNMRTGAMAIVWMRHLTVTVLACSTGDLPTRSHTSEVGRKWAVNGMKMVK